MRFAPKTVANPKLSAWTGPALLAFLVASPLVAQLSWIRDFKIPEYYKRSELPQDRPSQLKSLLQAAEAQSRTPTLVEARGVRIETYQTNGVTNLVVTAPHCTLDLDQRTAASPGRLEARTGDGRFFIEGTGFLCQLTNARITMTNGVRTVIRKDARWPDVSKP